MVKRCILNRNICKECRCYMGCNRSKRYSFRLDRTNLYSLENQPMKRVLSLTGILILTITLSSCQEDLNSLILDSFPSSSPVVSFSLGLVRDKDDCSEYTVQVLNDEDNESEITLCKERPFRPQDGDGSVAPPVLRQPRQGMGWICILWSRGRVRRRISFLYPRLQDVDRVFSCFR